MMVPGSRLGLYQILFALDLVGMGDVRLAEKTTHKRKVAKESPAHRPRSGLFPNCNPCLSYALHPKRMAGQTNPPSALTALPSDDH